MLNPHLEIGQCVNNEDIRRVFKCGNMSGMKGMTPDTRKTRLDFIMRKEKEHWGQAPGRKYVAFAISTGDGC